MRFHDIYDDMPDGHEQRRHNERRIAELEQEGQVRRDRIALVVADAELSRAVVAPAGRHSL